MDSGALLVLAIGVIATAVMLVVLWLSRPK